MIRFVFVHAARCKTRMRSRRFRSGFGVPSVAALMAEVDIVPQLSLPRREESNFLSKLLRAPCIPKQGDMQSVTKTPAPLLTQIHNPANPLWFGHRDPFRHQKDVFWTLRWDFSKHLINFGQVLRARNHKLPLCSDGLLDQFGQDFRTPTPQFVTFCPFS